MTVILHVEKYTFFYRIASTYFYHIAPSSSQNYRCFRQLIDKVKTHILYSITFIFFFENRAICEITWKNIVEPDRAQMTVRRKRIACWVPKATDRHTESGVPSIFFRGGDCSTNSVEDRAQRERRSGGARPTSQGFWRQL